MNSAPRADSPSILSIADVFDDQTYRVPLYQRAYAWTASEINTLLADVRDARLETSNADFAQEPRDYYLGALVVNSMRVDDHVVHEVVDGQQRLTTLYVILSVAPRILRPQTPDPSIDLHGRLVFEGRDATGEDLRRLATDGAPATGRMSTGGIIHAVDIVQQACHRGVGDSAGDDEGQHEASFSAADLDFLLHHVKILRTELPPRTDLNHYFEVMNTRGEQLEKHEILKARMVSALGDGSDARTFSKVWDACSVLDRHIQIQFSTALGKDSDRSRIFGDDWSSFLPTTPEDIFAVLADRTGKSGQGTGAPGDGPEGRGRLALANILHGESNRSDTKTSSEPGDESGAYRPIIDFPNLLLHVLKIQLKETYSWDVIAERPGHIRLEDKYLLAEFKRVMDAMATEGGVGRVAAWVREFGLLLLKTRYLMDSYVIRTQATPAGDDEENWVLHRAFKYRSDKVAQQLSVRATFSATNNHFADGFDTDQQTQRRALMLQAMFQVTDTRRASKHFLFQILDWLHRQEMPGSIGGDLLVHHLESMARDRLRALGSSSSPNRGTGTPNFLFNVLDYTLWKLVSVGSSEDAQELLGKSSA